MTKDEVISKLLEYGDATVTYRSENSNKLKYNVVTLDFNNRHIAQRHTHAKEDDTTILTFAWDIDSFRLIKPELITSVVPLSKALKNHV